ncbi:putative pleckstrin domain, PH-like domain superfamily, protein-tyrosine phosphatase [Plasmopara halstedii]
MKALRAAVSGSRVRFMQDGFDLDLTYITPKLIAMGYPASGVEKTYRNDINEVANFLNSRHPYSYRVYNLSERSYDYTKFEGRVNECGFPDHHPPPLQLLLDIINDMIEWVAKSSKHVLVVHCLAGKGRTGVVCSCFLLLMGYYGSVFKLRKEHELRELANSSIRDFWSARGQGVRFPSQALYIYYFLKVLRRMGRVPTQIPPLRPAKKMLLRTIVLNGVPDFEAPPHGGCTPFLQVLPAPSQHHQPQLLYNSSWQNPKFETYLADPFGSIMFEINVEVQGDVLVRCFHANTTNILGKRMIKMFHFTFNTDFFHNYSNLYRLPKVEVDEATGNSRYPDNFQILCHVEILDADGNPYPSVSKSRSNSSVRDDGVEQQRPQLPPQRRMTAPTHQSYHEFQMRRQPSGRPEETPPTMQGWLFKQGGFVKNWKKRWFVACEGKMMYYHGMSDAKPLGIVNLRRVTVEVCEAYEVNARNQELHYFKVMPPSAGQRTYIFGAESERDLVTWVRVLGAQSTYGILDGVLQRNPNMQRNARYSYQQEHQPHDFGLNRQRYNSRSYHFGDPRLAPSPMSMSMPTNGYSPSHDERPSAQSSATRQAYQMSSSDARNAADVMRGRRDTMPSDLSEAVQRALAIRSLSYTDNDERGSNLFPSAASAMQNCVPAEPVADLTNTLSALEQASLLQEVNGFATGIYIYSADELQEAALLQKYMRETRGDPDSIPSVANGTKTSPPGSLCQQLQQYVEQNRMNDAEQLLTELVLLKFPRLVDAMDHDPLAFTKLIAGEDICVATSRVEDQDYESDSEMRLDSKGHRRALFF